MVGLLPKALPRGIGWRCVRQRERTVWCFASGTLSRCPNWCLMDPFVLTWILVGSAWVVAVLLYFKFKKKPALGNKPGVDWGKYGVIRPEPICAECPLCQSGLGPSVMVMGGTPCLECGHVSCLEATPEVPM